MGKYFEGKIEYSRKQENGTLAHQLTYVKDDYCRIEAIFDTYHFISIYTPKIYYSISLEEKKIVNCSTLFNIEEKSVSFEEINDTKKIFNLDCQPIKIKGEIQSFGEVEEINEIYFVHKSFCIHPLLKEKATLFITEYLPLKTIHYVNIDDEICTSIFTVSEIKEMPLSPSIFEINQFENLEIITFQEDKERQEEEWKKEEEEREKDMEIEKLQRDSKNNILYKPMIHILNQYKINVPQEAIDEPRLTISIVHSLEEEIRNNILVDFLKALTKNNKST